MSQEAIMGKQTRKKDLVKHNEQGVIICSAPYGKRILRFLRNYFKRKSKHPASKKIRRATLNCGHSVLFPNNFSVSFNFKISYWKWMACTREF